MLLKSSEGCQMCGSGQISRAGCSRTGDSRQTGQSSPCLSVSRCTMAQQLVVLPRYSGWTGWTAHWPMSTYSCGRLPCCAWSVCGFGSQIQNQSESGLSSDGLEFLLPPLGRWRSQAGWLESPAWSSRIQIRTSGLGLEGEEGGHPCQRQVWPGAGP